MVSIAADLMTLPPPERRLWLAEQDDRDIARVLAISRSDLGSPFALWRDDPVGFIEDVLAENLWSTQRTISWSVLENRRTAVPACNGPGKALADGTLVLTPGGWVKIEDLRVGDEVMAADGAPTAVVGVYPQGVRHLYRLHFTDGTTIDADDDHLWATVRRRGPKRGSLDLVTTAQMRERAGEFPISIGRPRIPTCASMRFPHRDVPLDPYLLGALLGDGHVCQPTPRLSTKDPEILALAGFADAKPTKHCSYDYPLLGIADRVRAAGIGDLRSWEKRVPDAYLWNDEETRLAVLRGLCDTDGTVSARAGDAAAVEFSTTSPQLADDVAFLARSLGAQVRTSSARRTSYAHRGERRLGRESFRVRIFGGPCPFALRRKADRWNAAHERRTTTTDRLVKRIEDIGYGSATCIRVAHSDRLFVAENFVVTHNSHLAARLFAWWMSVWEPSSAKAVSTAHTWKHVRNLLWPHITRVHRKHGLPGRVNQTEWVFDNEVYGWGFSPGKYDEAAGQGIHADHLLVIVDEAGGIDPILGNNLNSLMTGEDCHLLAIGNPPTEDESGWFESICESALWNTIRIPAFQTPNFTDEKRRIPIEVLRQLVNPIWVDEIRQQYGEDSAYYIARVLALFPKVSASRAIPVLWVENAMNNDVPAETDWQRLGIDVADGGGDEMVVAHADGYRIRVIDSWFGADAADQVLNAERILPHIQYAEKIQERRGFTDRRVRVKIDAIGVGAGTADVLTHMGAEGKHSADIVHVQVSEKANDPAKYRNKRAECWWNMRDACREGIVKLMINERQKAQLAGPLYGTDTKGRIFIESKDDMKKRGLPSPDHADAMNLTIYEPVSVAQSESYAEQIRSARLPRSIGRRRS